MQHWRKWEPGQAMTDNSPPQAFGIVLLVVLALLLVGVFAMGYLLGGLWT